MLDFAFDPGGKRALVLTRDGLLHSLDARTLQEQANFMVTGAVPTGADEPVLAVGRQYLYVSEPAAGKVHVLHAASATVVQEIELPGAPGPLLVFRYAE